MTEMNDLDVLLEVQRLNKHINELKAENERLRRWVFATAMNFERSGLMLEEYNAITKEVIAAFGQEDRG